MVFAPQANEEWLRFAVLRRGRFMKKASVNDFSQLPMEVSVRLSHLVLRGFSCAKVTSHESSTLSSHQKS